MKLLGKFPDPLLAEIGGQPDAIRRTASGLTDHAEALVEVARRASERTLVFTGMGSSYFACYAPATYLGGAGVPVVMTDAAELLHFRRPSLEGSLVVAVSQSGESAEVVRLVDDLRRDADRPFVVSITNGSSNPLAEKADLGFDTRVGEEHGPSTMTFAGSLVVLAAIGRVLAGEDAASAVEVTRAGAETAAAAIETLLESAEDTAARLGAWLGDRPVLALLGRGTARAASEMAALMIKEAARYPAESLEVAQFRHGPLELAGEGTAVGIVATEPETSELDLGFATELVEHGTAVLAVSADGSGPDGAERVAVGEQDRLLAPAVGIVPLQLLSWRLTIDRGRDPGAYTIASKVTRRE
ncbi:MAG TPA: SIS domain-containing protein [Actinomycetota bacterium]|nr:SIS domain-containing protein [Actinomycetota bacterium]